MKQEPHNTYTVQLLFANNPLPMWIYDLITLDFLDVNRAAVTQYGYTREEFLNMKITAIRPEEDVQTLLDHLAKERPDLQYSGDWRHRVKNGNVIHVQIKSHRIQFNGREAALVVSQDITERFEAEGKRQQLLERERLARIKSEHAEKRFAFLAESSRVLASSLDYEETLSMVAKMAVPAFADWCIVDILEADGNQANRLVIYHADDEKITLARELYQHYSLDPQLKMGSRQVLRTGEPEMVAEISPALIESIITDPEVLLILQKLKLNSYIIVPIIAHNQVLGTITWVMAESQRRYRQADLDLAEDLARRAALAIENARLYSEANRLNQELEERVNQRTAQLETINNELEAFTYSVSHDLRAPLRSISGFSQALLEEYQDVVDETGEHYLKRVQAASQRMGELIDDLLRLSRITRSQLRYTTVDLSEIAQKIARNLQQWDPDRNVHFEIESNISVEGDANLLHILLQNLFDNAWKFSRNRDQTTIKFNRYPGAEGSVYRVQDNGVGFDMAYADKLFGAFQRLHSFADFSGTGIGLATVKRIINRHGGRVWAEAEIDQGAMFPSPKVK